MQQVLLLQQLLLPQLLLDAQDLNGKLTNIAMTSTTMQNATMMVETAVDPMLTLLIAMSANVLTLILQRPLLLRQRSIQSVKMTLLGAAIAHIGFQLAIALIKTLSHS